MTEFRAVVSERMSDPRSGYRTIVIYAQDGGQSRHAGNLILTEGQAELLENIFDSHAGRMS